MKNLFKIVMSCMTIITGISLVGCHNDLYLEPVSQISGSSFWKTPDDAQSGLNGMYVRLKHQATDNLFIWGEARSQSIDFAQGGGWILHIVHNTLTSSTMQTNESQSFMDWRRMYTIIHDANLILKYVPDIQFVVEGDKNNILAQAYAMRAYVYYVLTRTWGDLPLATEPFEAYSVEIVQRGRSSQQEVFTLIKNDIDEALKLFPDNQLASKRNYWSKPAVYALKADVYLWTAKTRGGGNTDLNTALEALNEAEKCDVVLLDDFASVFDYENKSNREVLMTVTMKDGEMAGNSIYSQMYLSEQYMPFGLDEETRAIILPVGGYPYLQIGNHVAELFSVDDQRKRATYIELYDTDESGNKELFLNLPLKMNGTVIGGVRRFYDDFVIYRYADILLMRAEVKNALGQDPSSDINKIRERAYKDNFSAHAFVNGTKEDNDAIILQERLLEFVLEGKYWWDLIRFDKVFELIPNLIGRDQDRYLLLWPISLQTLSLEPNVQQNQGW